MTEQDTVRQAYFVLGLELGAPLDEISGRHKRLIMAWHPDRFPTADGKKDATDELKKINNAKDVLENHFKNTHKTNGACACKPNSSASAADEFPIIRSSPAQNTNWGTRGAPPNPNNGVTVSSVSTQLYAYDPDGVASATYVNDGDTLVQLLNTAGSNGGYSKVQAGIVYQGLGTGLYIATNPGNNISYMVKPLHGSTLNCRQGPLLRNIGTTTNGFGDAINSPISQTTVTGPDAHGYFTVSYNIASCAPLIYTTLGLVVTNGGSYMIKGIAIGGVAIPYASVNRVLIPLSPRQVESGDSSKIDLLYPEYVYEPNSTELNLHWETAREMWVGCPFGTSLGGTTFNQYCGP